MIEIKSIINKDDSLEMIKWFPNPIIGLGIWIINKIVNIRKINKE